MKNQKGITLIALVITIIVLLILAGVSIAMLAGENGILNQATKSGDETKISEQKEQVALVINELTSEYYEQKYVQNNTTTAAEKLGDYVGKQLSSKLSGYAKVTSASGSYTIETLAKNKEGKVATATFTTSNSKLGDWTMAVPAGTGD